MPNITAAYLRVSTLDQTVAAQRQAIAQMGVVLNRDLTWYEDIASGVTRERDRPGLARLMADVRAGAVRQVVVWKFDRFARSVQHLLDALEEFRTRGVIFTSLTEGIDTSTAVGRMVYTFLAAIAEFERGLIRERIGAGIVAAKKRGVRFGRPRLTVGTGTVELLKDRGFKITEIAHRLGIARATVRERLALAALEHQKGEPDEHPKSRKGAEPDEHPKSRKGARHRVESSSPRRGRSEKGPARNGDVEASESVEPRRARAQSSERERPPGAVALRPGNPRAPARERPRAPGTPTIGRRR
jgi:DNA invertase Pin-like site-specific DNA recombinase